MKSTLSHQRTDNSLVKSVNSQYYEKLMRFNDYTIIETVGNLYKVDGFDNYNQLLDINAVFSACPNYAPVDRTGMGLGPIRHSPERAWAIPTQQLTLAQAMQQRVAQLCEPKQKINLLWSGGIDSTAIAVAFLQHAPDLAQCRIVYSPWSTYEHPEFFELLKQVPNLELLDNSGEAYLNMDLDGIVVSGNTGDEMHASLDASFFTKHGFDFLSTPWQDFFYQHKSDSNFIEFCKTHFAQSGREITTVLEARWWFYLSTKLTSIINCTNLALFTADAKQFDPKRLIGFFDCDCYEQFIYFNVDQLILSNNYATWRQFLKDYCYQYDGFDDWRVNKTKFGSNQIQSYTFKKQILNNARNIMLLDNGERVATPNLPLFSQHEWDCIKHQYVHVFRKPDARA
jgi:hypothetical protein